MLQALIRQWKIGKRPSSLMYSQSVLMKLARTLIEANSNLSTLTKDPYNRVVKLFLCFITPGMVWNSHFITLMEPFTEIKPSLEANVFAISLTIVKNLMFIRVFQ
jgi:hypothetical protein